MRRWTQRHQTNAIRCLKIGTAFVALGLWWYACSSTPPHPPQKSTPARPKPYRVGKYWYHPLPHAKDYKERGIASWYGRAFHGKRTSNGEIYDMYAMTAAHKTLPLGVFVRVTNLKNNKNIEVRINDRGPFIRGRIIDLSYTAAQKLDIVGPGTAPVEVVALGAPPAPGPTKTQKKYTKVDYFSGEFTFQVGAFSDRNNAQRLVNQLKTEYDNAHMVTYDSGSQIFYRVRVGKATNLQDAERFERELIQKGYRGTFIVAQ